MNKIHLSKVGKDIANANIVKQKRERAVLQNGELYYKIWVPNWTQAKIVEHAYKCGFYNDRNTNSVLGLIYDESGPRGYIQRKGKTIGDNGDNKSWKNLTKMVSKKQCVEFLQEVMTLSLEVDGTFSDFAPSNIIIFEGGVNLIDLESFRSFDLIFDRKTALYENFDLDAWWKPHETAKRDVNKYFKSYFKECLGIQFEFDIDSRENYKRALNELLNY